MKKTKLEELFEDFDNSFSKNVTFEPENWCLKDTQSGEVMMTAKIKDSGKRIEYNSGMKRDVQDDKPDFTLLFPEDLPFEKQPLTIFAHHLRLGAQKYGRRNWEKANSQEELDRFKQSALRHLLQALSGEEDEDHLSAVLFNIIAWMYTKEKIKLD